MIKLNWLKSASFKVKWNLREVYKVTQWKDDCVYRTRSLGFIVCPSDYQLLGGQNYSINSVSTSISRQL